MSRLELSQILAFIRNVFFVADPLLFLWVSFPFDEMFDRILGLGGRGGKLNARSVYTATQKGEDVYSTRELDSNPRL
jgi:hypothetical protein